MEDKAGNSACQKIFLRWKKDHASGYLWALDQLEVLYWPVLTKLSWPEVRTSKSKPEAIHLLQIGFQNVPTEMPAGKISSSHRQDDESNDLLSMSECRQPGAGCSKLKNKKATNLWGTPAGGRGDTALPLRNTVQKKTSNRCKTPDMDYAVENHPALPLNKKDAVKKLETSAIMSSKTLLQQGYNTKPLTDQLTVQVRIGKDEISNISGPQGTVSYIRNKDRNFANKSLATSNLSPQEKLEVKHVLPGKFSRNYKELVWAYKAALDNIARTPRTPSNFTKSKQIKLLRHTRELELQPSNNLSTWDPVINNVCQAHTCEYCSVLWFPAGRR